MLKVALLFGSATFLYTFAKWFIHSFTKSINIMNNSRRKELSSLHEQLDFIKAEVERIRDEEQEYFDNMPESFQYGEKGEKAEAAIENLDNALSSLEEVLDAIDEAVL